MTLRAGGPAGLRFWIVAGEESGDQLGFKLIRALRARFGPATAFAGVGGDAMAAEGLASLFPLADVAVMGVLPVIARLPLLLARIRATAAAVVAARPDALILVDSPGFTHAVAKRVRRSLPDVPIVDYVSPKVWAWRSWRARQMRAYVDHVLALLSFEPAAYVRLGGPPCTYVGHPLIERLAELRPSADEARAREDGPPLILALPGSRRSEIGRLMADFGDALHRVAAVAGPIEVVLPAVARHEAEIRARAALWPTPPRLVLGEEEKFAAFRRARAALAASGTVTLELALSGVPMVVAYKVSRLEEQLKHVIDVPSIVLPNLVLGERAIPERLQRDCDPAILAADVLALLAGPARAAQRAALGRLDDLMRLPDGAAPSARAAEVIAGLLRPA